MGEAFGLDVGELAHTVDRGVGPAGSFRPSPQIFAIRRRAASRVTPCATSTFAARSSGRAALVLRFRERAAAFLRSLCAIATGRRSRVCFWRSWLSHGAGSDHARRRCGRFYFPRKGRLALAPARGPELARKAVPSSGSPAPDALSRWHGHFGSLHSARAPRLCGFGQGGRASGLAILGWRCGIEQRVATDSPTGRRSSPTRKRARHAGEKTRESGRMEGPKGRLLILELPSRGSPTRAKT